MIKWIKNHVVLSLVIVAVLAGASYGGLELTMQPFFCNSCHEMNRVCSSWKSASHSEVGCMECHAAPGLLNLLKAKASAMKSPYYHFFTSEATIREHLKHHTETPDSACLKCHPDILKVDRVVNMAALHQKHYTMPGADCQNCHENIGHCGAIPENDLQQHMKLCLDCHEKNKQTKAPQKDGCDSCHLGEREMLKGTGGLEVENIDGLMPDLACTDCHNNEESFRPDEKTCVDCHDEKYPAYIKEWQNDVKGVFPQVEAKYKNAAGAIKKLGNQTDLVKAFEVGKHDFLAVKKDGSRGVHNSEYAVALLNKAGEKFDLVINGAK